MASVLRCSHLNRALGIRNNMNTFRTIEEYTDIKEALVTMCGLFLFEFAKESNLETKDIMLRNFLAKSIMSLKGVFALGISKIIKIVGRFIVHKWIDFSTWSILQLGMNFSYLMNGLFINKLKQITWLKVTKDFH